MPEALVGQNRESHILLAACGRDQYAAEFEGHGVFTTALISLLENVNWSTLDYATLIRKLELSVSNLTPRCRRIDVPLLGCSNIPLPRKQTPHCDGHHINRVLFTTNTTDASFISGQVDRGKIVLNAGKAQGIWIGAQVGIYDSNFASADVNPLLATLVVSDVVTASNCTLTADPTVEIPLHFYAKLRQRRLDEYISVHCEDEQRLKALLKEALKAPELDLAAAGIEFSGNAEVADLVVLLKDERVAFERKEDFITKHLGKRVPCTASISDPNGILNVLQATAHFNYHLNRTNLLESCIKPPESITMEFGRVEFGTDFTMRVVKLSDSKDSPATFFINFKEEEDDEPMYALTICNRTALQLYPYLFSFEPCDLSIRKFNFCQVFLLNNDEYHLVPPF
jgi:hypothetical protein